MSFVAKLRKWSNYSALHRFDVKTIKNVQWCQKHSKERKTTKLIKLQWIASIWCQNDKKKTQNYKRDQITINLHRFDVKTIKKHWGTVAKHSKQRKTTKLIKLQLIASICLQNNPKCWDTSQNYESDQTTKVIKAQWIASIWRQNDLKSWDTSQNIQNNAKLRK